MRASSLFTSGVQALAGVAGIVSVMVLASWHDITGSTAMIAVLALTGTSGAHALSALTTNRAADAVAQAQDTANNTPGSGA